MRILFLANDFPSPWLPTKGTFNFELARSLAAQHEVQVLAPIPWFSELARRTGISPELTKARTEKRDGLTIYYPRYYYTPKIGRSWYDWYMWYSVKSSLKKLAVFRPDAVIGYWPFPDGAVAVKFARQIGATSFVMAGGSGILIHAHESKWRRRKIVEALSAADGVLAVSADLRQKTIELGIPAEKVHLVYRGVDRERFSPGDKAGARRRLGLPQRVPLFLWVGRMVPVKGLDVLLQAAAGLQRRGRPFQLILAGDGFERRRFEVVAAALGLGEAARFVGPVLHHELADWFRAADWTVLTSHSEGVPNVLLESHACGTPFIATRVGGVAEIAVDGVDRLVAPADHEEFAEQMSLALATPRADAERVSSQVSGLDTAANRIAEIIGRCVDESGDGSIALRATNSEISGVPADSLLAPVLSGRPEEISDAEIYAAASAHEFHPRPVRQMIRNAMTAVLPRRLFLTAGPPNSGQVCLTFDDGPDPEYTPRCLDVLGELGIKATFFVIGRKAAQYPQIVRRIVADGHEVGNHSWSHYVSKNISVSEFAAELQRTAAFLADLTGRPCFLFRPPHGKLTPRQLFKAWALQQTIVLWNRDPKDFARRSADDLTGYFEACPVQGGDVVLLHDNQPYAIAALPRIVAGIHGQKLSLATPGSWFARGVESGSRTVP